jgi:hypothetical protein
MIEFAVLHGDAAEVASDLLILKYAQCHYGVDEIIAQRLSVHGVSLPDSMPKPGDFVLVDCRGAIRPHRVMFLGTPPLGDFDYLTIKELAARAAEVLIKQLLPVQHVTMVNHGVNFGLDPEESLKHMVMGILDASRGSRLGMLERVTLVEFNARRAQLQATYLAENLPRWRAEFSDGSRQIRGNWAMPTTVLPDTPLESEQQQKEHVFVAMPFSDTYEDVYEFGIYAAVRDQGYVCEHVGQAAFMGDVLERITNRIQTAKFVIADLSEARPNVYLEVGYAWGCGVPTIIIAREGQELHFDVSRHRCIFYKNIKHLARELTALIQRLESW